MARRPFRSRLKTLGEAFMPDPLSPTNNYNYGKPIAQQPMPMPKPPLMQAPVPIPMPKPIYGNVIDEDVPFMGRNGKRRLPPQRPIR